jgi:glucokinase
MTTEAGPIIGAIDIGGTKIAVGIVNDEGRVLASDECPTDQDRGFTDAVDRMERMLRNCAARAHVPIDGIGIGCTGPVYPRTGEIGDVAFLQSWRGANLIEQIESRFGVRAAYQWDSVLTWEHAVAAGALMGHQCGLAV